MPTGGVIDSLSLNHYTYCANNPILYCDPSGHYFEEVWEYIKISVRYILHFGDWFASEKLGIDTAEIGAILLDMYRETNGICHARFDCWQAYFGYNDIYDYIFDIGTSMRSAKFDFLSDGHKYILWARKGDYINLGAGAELGIYENLFINGYETPHYIVNKELAVMMTLTLSDKHGNIIFHFAPDDEQWWITGFNLEYKNVSADDLTATYTITLKNKQMYIDFKNSLDDNELRWTFDDRIYTATFTF